MKIISFLWLIFLCLPLSAQPIIPKDFTATSVTPLVTNITEKRSYPTLKYFFSHRKKYTLSRSQAIALIETQAGKTGRGSKEWFMIQSLRAYGSIQTSANTQQKGVSVYGGLFDEAMKTPRLKEHEYLRNIIYDYVSLVPTPLIGSRAPLLTNPSADEVLNKALFLYFRFGSPEGIWQPDWEAAINYTSFDVWPYLKTVDSAMAKQDVEKNANFYRVAIDILQVSNTGDRGEGKEMIEKLEEQAKRLVK